MKNKCYPTNYRVWRFANMEIENYFYVESPEEGARLINALAELDLQNPIITDNVFDFQEFVSESDGWETWYNADGENIDFLCDVYREFGGSK